MITETDWELGLPPYDVPVEVFVGDHLRSGIRSSWSPSYFRFDDCTHPQQNVVAPLEFVTAWRYNQQGILDRLMAKKVDWSWPKFPLGPPGGGTFYYGNGIIQIIDMDAAHSSKWNLGGCDEKLDQ